MHRSRLAGFIIDCQDADPETAAGFWGQALGMTPCKAEEKGFVRLDAAGRDLHVEVQCVTHESRLHLDIETDDVDLEVARLEKLGARRIAKKDRWWVMEAPTRQRFCVVRAGSDLLHTPGATLWP